MVSLVLFVQKSSCSIFVFTTYTTDQFITEYLQQYEHSIPSLSRAILRFSQTVGYDGCSSQ